MLRLPTSVYMCLSMDAHRPSGHGVILREPSRRLCCACPAGLPRPTAAEEQPATLHFTLQQSAKISCSDGLLDSSDRVCFYDRLGWLRLHHHLFAEHLPLASLGGRLHAGLQPGHTWDDELASLFHLSRGQGCEGVHDLRANCLLQPMLLTAFLLPFMAFMAFMGARDFGRAIFTGCRAE